MGEKRKSFQDRALRIESDGADFEQFVFETFRVAKEEAGFSKQLARGRDGAIDLLDRFTEAGASTIAECKYIGSGGAAEATARWNPVGQRLKKYLPELHADPRKSPGSPYRGWLDPKRPVTRYRFCVSTAMQAEEVKALERRITADFAEIVAAGVAPLRTLAENEDGAVRVLPWDWFDAEIGEHPTLGFRWFRGLPPGVDLFEPELGGSATFRDFLRAGELRYFSRDEYEGRGLGQLERGERELTAALAETGMQALLITGPGGLGKTRLCWELASELARPPYGFDVYRVGRSAGFASVVELAAGYRADASILLLVDYAEAAHELPRIADAVEHVTSNSGLRMRVIATCRASAGNQVRDGLGVLAFEEKSLGSAKAGETAFVSWVAQSILALEALPWRDRIELVCRDVPALAAFAVFLHRRHPRQFNTQFGALHELEDFEKWAAHRIAALVGVTGANRHEAERSLARIALSLPLPASRLEAITAENPAFRSLTRTLIDDRWIEREEGQYHAAHDVLADALAARWLFETESAATDRTLDILQHAGDADEFERNLIALERLAPHPKFGEIEGRELVAELAVRRADEVAGSLRQLLSGLLLSTEDKLDLLYEHPAIRERARTDRLLDGPVSYVAEQTAKKGLRPDDPSVAALLDLLDHATLHDQPSNMILRRAYALDPARFRTRAIGNLAFFPTAEPTHFLLVQMLRSGEPAASLESWVRYWADHNATASRASFLYRTWLEHGGSLETVAKPLLAWVAEHGTTTEAQFVYKPWLDRGGSIEAVEKSLVAWVAAHGTRLDARFVYGAWLTHNGSFEAVETSLLGWMAEHATAREASYVYEAWLDRRGATEAVEDLLHAWWAAHGITPEAQFVYTAWLNRGGSIEAVETPLRAWVAEHGARLDASHVFVAWLDRGGAIEAVAEALLAWVAEHGTKAEASHVYKAWLDRGGAIEAVQEPLLSWVMEHGAEFDADFVFRSWLERGGAFECVQDQVYRWSLLWCETPEFVYLSKALSKRNDLPEPVALAIGRWCTSYAEHEDSLYRLSSLIGHLRTETLSASGLKTLLAIVSLTVERHPRTSALANLQIWLICVALGRRFFNLDPFGITRTVAGIVAEGKLFDAELAAGSFDALRNSHELMVQLVLYALRWDMLRIDGDFDALACFAGWLRSSTDDEACAARLLGRLNTEFPSEAWNGSGAKLRTAR
jgi:hypothetical protein